MGSDLCSLFSDRLRGPDIFEKSIPRIPPNSKGRETYSCYFLQSVCLQLKCFKDSCQCGAQLLLTQSRLRVEQHLRVSEPMETGRNLVLLFVSNTSQRVFYPNSTISVPSKTHTCSPQAWKPEATMDTSQDGGACSSPTGTRDQGTFFLLLRGWYRMGLFIPLWPKIGFSYLNGAARLLHFQKTCFPSLLQPWRVSPFLLLRWLFSLQDQGCSRVLERERELFEISLALCGEWELLFHLQVPGPPQWSLLWKRRLFVVLSSRDALLPTRYIVPHIELFCSIGSIFLSCGASLFGGQVLHGLLTWMISAAVPAASIWAKQPKF